MVNGQFVVRAQFGVGVHIDDRPGAVTSVPHGEGEVAHQAGGEVVRGGRQSGERDRVVEGHDVDDRCVPGSHAAGQCEVALDVLGPVPLVGAQFAHA